MSSDRRRQVQSSRQVELPQHKTQGQERKEFWRREVGCSEYSGTDSDLCSTAQFAGKREEGGMGLHGG